MMQTVILAVVILGGLGIVFGAVLAFAAKVFAVEKDPREEAISECLPGANCGGCGYPGCGGYAAAVVKGEAPVNKCAAGGAAVAAQIAEIMGVAAGESVKMVAAVHCSGCGAAHQKYEYIGVHDCVAAARLPGGGPLSCDFGCLGMGSCEKVCPFDAIHVVDGVAKVDEDKCKACNQCVDVCPRHIIALEPYKTKKHVTIPCSAIHVVDGVAKVDEDKCKACNQCVDVCPRHIIALEPYKTKKHVTIPCSSKEKGPAVTKVCTNGCIGCSLCAKSCPKEAITMVNNLAVIDYEKCIGCGICAQKCPRKLITVDGKVPEVKPAAPKAAPAAPKAAAPAAEAPKAETKE